MNTVTKLDPIVSEFETSEQEEHYNKWLQTKVQAAMADTRPGIPHDEAMALLNLKLEALRQARRP
jgi:hypothetical protein